MAEYWTLSYYMSYNYTYTYMKFDTYYIVKLISYIQTQIYNCASIPLETDESGGS